VRVASEVVGRIAWVSPDFSNGGSIRANEPFIRIDAAEFELQVEAAEMAVREADAQVWVERAGAEEGIRAFERDNPGVEPSEAIRRLPSIAEAEARLMRAQTDLKLAELRLERTNISLPYDGRVTASDVEVGELVGPADQVDGPSSRLGIVYRPEALQVAVPIELRDLEYLDPVIGRSARVLGEMASWEARVARVSSVLAPRTRLASVFPEVRGGRTPGLAAGAGHVRGGRHHGARLRGRVRAAGIRPAGARQRLGGPRRPAERVFAGDRRPDGRRLGRAGVRRGRGRARRLPAHRPRGTGGRGDRSVAVELRIET